jgi:hypothetical protein
MTGFKKTITVLIAEHKAMFIMTKSEIELQKILQWDEEPATPLFKVLVAPSRTIGKFAQHGYC